MEYFKTLPASDALIGKWSRDQRVPEVNGHLHSPYSFCSFRNIGQMFSMAEEEHVKVLGINDFFTVDGYDEFARLSLEHGIFPLFNIEFTGLMKDLQQKGVRVNDPNNPGRVYFSGKALRHPLAVSGKNLQFLDDLQLNSQEQVRKMIQKADAHLHSVGAPFSLTYEGVRQQYAEKLVRERHIARAIREGISVSIPSPGERDEFYTRMFGGKKLSASQDDKAGVENEIRSHILKKGGKAFVVEDNRAFPEIRKILDFIVDAGGIPCYPALLDDKNGKMTGFEGDWDMMDEVLRSLDVYCLELIPARNSLKKLSEFVELFNEKGYIITFGTEHNAPGLSPITVAVEKDKALPAELKKISWEGCCALAAHQYLVARGEEGIPGGMSAGDLQKHSFYVDLGNAIIKKFTS